MTLRVTQSAAARNAMLAALATLLDGGTLKLYSTSSAAPASPSDAVPLGAVVLATFALGTPSDAEIDDGVVTFTPHDSAVLASGIVAWARASTVGNVGVLDLNVGVDDEAIVLPRVALVVGEPITLAEWTYALPALVEVES